MTLRCVCQTGEFSWSKMFSLGLQLVLSVLGGGDNAAIDRLDTGSPVEVRQNTSIPESLLSYLMCSMIYQSIYIYAIENCTFTYYNCIL